MKIYKKILICLIFSGIFSSCYQDMDDQLDGSVGNSGPDRNLDIENFIYSGMNLYYVYKSDIPELANNYFSNEDDKNLFLAEFEGPEDLFRNGLKVPAPKDRFSFITDDYIELENSFSGISTTTGMNYGLSLYSSGSSKVFGFVRYVVPESPADEQGINRGMIFTQIDGQQLSVDNYNQLLGQDNFRIHLAEIEGTTINETGQKIDLFRRELTENPILLSKTFEIDGKTIGYLMYNGFTKEFDDELNAEFANFKSAGVDEFILDLRYNGGGSVETAVDLASMLTGQFNGEIFSKQQWNEDIQDLFDPESIVDKFNDKIRTGEKINSLNLNKVYVIATSSSASASELVINGLDPHIQVEHVGDTTVGKFQASITLYDSSNFGRQNANPNHTYAIQPLVYESTNANGVSAYENGLIPDVLQKERVTKLGVLGDIEEPLLALTLAEIRGVRHQDKFSEIKMFRQIGEIGEDKLDFQRMYSDKIPQIIEKNQE